MELRVSAESDCAIESGGELRVQDYAEIVVIRHGETAWNSEGRIQGHIDVELNDTGLKQAMAVAERLVKEREISAVYSSDLKRARHTAQTIASRCNVPEVIEDSDLRERHLGFLQGLVLHEATEKPDAYKASLLARTDEEIPGGGESLDQLYCRCTSALLRIGRKHKGERVVVVTHGGVLRAFHKLAAPTVEISRKIQNASLNIFHFADEEKWTLNSWSDVSHLSNTGFLENAFGGDGTSG